MKTRDSWGGVLPFAVFAVLVSTISIFAFSHNSKKHSHSTVAASNATHNLSSSVKDNPQWIAAYGKLPLSFEENVGQSAQEVRYISRGSGYNLFLTADEAVLALRPKTHLDFTPSHRFASLRTMREARRNALRTNPITTVRLHLDGANANPKIVAANRLPGKVNYFVGNDPRNWHTDVPTFEKVNYSNIYPGIDLVFYGSQRRLEYDFVVAPGADPSVIAMKIDGSRNLRLNSRGDVVLSVPGGQVELQKPVIYQEVKGQRREVPGSFVIADNHRITFSVPNYDRKEPLILDPVLNYSTLVGGALDDDAVAIGVDANKNAYIAGNTTSTDFPHTTGAFQTAASPAAPNTAVFVSELDPTGTQLLYSSYLSGSTPGEVAFGLAVDSTGKVYVTGQTFSSDFPTNSVVTGFKTGTNTNAANGTGFVVKFDTTKAGAASFLYSSFIGGTNGDFGQGIAADSNGVAYVTGYTNSAAGTTLDTFQQVNGAITALPNAHGAGFLSKIDTTKSSNALLYSTYLGGDGANGSATGFGDAGFGVAVDSTGKAYVVGTTSSTNFNTISTNGYALTFPSGNTTSTAFFAQIDTTLLANQSLKYLTYLGGSGQDFGNAVALGPQNVAYVTGQTSSTTTLFPVTTGSYPTTPSTLGVAFISKIDPSKTPANSLIYSTLLGGSNGDDGLGIAVDANGNAYIAGKTSSLSSSAGHLFPVTPGAFQPSPAANAFGSGFVAEVNPGGNGQSDLVYSTFFGGSGNGNNQDLDKAEAIAIDSANDVYITGQTFSTNFPVAGTPTAPLHVGLNGTSDAFVAKLTLEPTLVVSPTSLDFGMQLIGGSPAASKTVTLTNNTGANIAYTSATITGTNHADFTLAPAATGCSPNIVPGTPCVISVTFTPTVNGAETASLNIVDADSTSPQVIPLTGTGTNTPTDFTLSASPSTLTVAQGASGTSTITINPAAFASAVALTCTGAPANSTCTLAPTSITSPATSTLTIATTAPTTSMVAPFQFTQPASPMSLFRIIPVFAAFFLFLLLRSAQGLRTRLALVTAMVVVLGIAGCGSSHHTTGGTPKGSYTLTVTGTSGSLSHTATISLTVN